MWTFCLEDGGMAEEERQELHVEQELLSVLSGGMERV